MSGANLKNTRQNYHFEHQKVARRRTARVGYPAEVDVRPQERDLGPYEFSSLIEIVP